MQPNLLLFKRKSIDTERSFDITDVYIFLWIMINFVIFLRAFLRRLILPNNQHRRKTAKYFTSDHFHSFLFDTIKDNRFRSIDFLPIDRSQILFLLINARTNDLLLYLLRRLFFISIQVDFSDKPIISDGRKIKKTMSSLLN